MPKKLDIEKVNKEFLKRGLVIIDGIYNNKDSKLSCIDSQNYKYILSFSNISDKRTKSFEIISKRNLYSIENIKNFIKINNGRCDVLSNNYYNTHTKIKLRCRCGCIFEVVLYSMINNKKFLCNECSLKIRAKKRMTSKRTTEKEINLLGYKKVDIKNRQNITVEDSLGYKYSTSIYNLKNNYKGIFRFSSYNKYTIYNILKYLEINKIEIEIVDKTERKINIRKDNIEWYCVECGDKFETTWTNIISNTPRKSQKHRCSNCIKSKSNLEYKVETYLKSINEKYKSEFRFNDCRNKKPLPFDFYLQEHNFVIEVQGSQHFYKNDMFCQDLEERQRLDSIKKQYCINNNIKYLSIPFWDIYNSNKYIQSINNILNQK